MLHTAQPKSRQGLDLYRGLRRAVDALIVRDEFQRAYRRVDLT